jgi:isoleucyl-tRNA synthetase
MESYRLYNVVPALFEFIEDLTNWYIRLNRGRFWTEEMTDDKRAAYGTLYTTLFELNQSMAPFAPFLSETIYQELTRLSTAELPKSVHLCNYPEPEKGLIDPVLERAVTRMQHIILLGRQKRNQEKIKTKYPLSGLTVIHKETALLEEIAKLENYIQAELNVKEVAYTTDEDEYINLYAKPNAPVLGKRLGKDFRRFRELIEILSHEQIAKLQETGEMELDGEVFSQDDILVFREAREGTNAISDRFVSIDMNCTLNDDLISEGLAREIVNRIQRSRKDRNFNVADRINVRFSAGDELKDAIGQHQDYIKRETLALSLEEGTGAQPLEFDIDGEKLTLFIEKA